MISSTVHQKPALRCLRAAAVAVVLALAGCGGDATPLPAISSAPASSGVPSPSDQGPTAAPRSTPTRASARDNVSLAKAAGATAERKAEGSTATSLTLDSTEQGGSIWAVTLVTEDGDNVDVELTADGRKVTRGPTKNVEGAGDRTANRAFVEAAELSYADALEDLPATVAGGRVTSLSLEHDGSRTVWRAEVTDVKGDRHEVELDARTGEVLRDT